MEPLRIRKSQCFYAVFEEDWDTLVGRMLTDVLSFVVEDLKRTKRLQVGQTIVLKVRLEKDVCDYQWRVEPIVGDER